MKNPKNEVMRKLYLMAFKVSKKEAKMALAFTNEDSIKIHVEGQANTVANLIAFALIELAVNLDVPFEKVLSDFNHRLEKTMQSANEIAPEWLDEVTPEEIKEDIERTKKENPTGKLS